jgi:hypothetical protein
MNHIIDAHLSHLSSISPVVLQLFPTLFPHIAGSSDPLFLRMRLRMKKMHVTCILYENIVNKIVIILSSNSINVP